VQVPRAYAEPQRVAAALLPTPQPVEPVEAPEPTFDPVPDAVADPEPQARRGKGGRKFRASFSGGAETAASQDDPAQAIEEPSAEGEPADDEGYEEEGYEEEGFEEEGFEEEGFEDEGYDDEEVYDEEEPFEEESESDDPARRSTGVPATLGGVVGSSPAPFSSPTPPQQEAEPRRPNRNPPPVSATPRTPALQPEDRGVSSTGRLDLELLPVSDPAPAVIAG